MTQQSARGIGQMFEGTLPQVAAVLAGTCNAIADGMQYGWSAPYVPRLQGPDSPFPVSDDAVTWLEALLMLGGLAGLPITIYTVDRLGRKGSIIIACCFNLLGWILIGVAQSVIYIYIARALCGLAADVAFVTGPMYVAEISDQRIRGFLSSIIFLMMLAGLLLVYCIGPFTPFYLSPVIAGTILITQLVIFPFMPESPYFLASKGRTEDAKHALSRLRSECDVDREIQEIIAAVERQKLESGRPQDLILVPSNRKAMIIMTVLNAAQHLGGYSIVLMNLHNILGAAGSIYMSPDAAAILFASLMFLAAATVSFSIDRFGRKVLLIASCTCTGLCLLTLAIYFNLKHMGIDVASASWIPIVSVMLYAVVLKFGLGLVPIVLTAELFPTNVKAIGMTTSDFMYIIWATISIYLFQYLSKACGMFAPFYIFAFCTFLTAVFTWFYIPETKGRSLDEIQFILKGQSYRRQSGSLYGATDNPAFIGVGLGNSKGQNCLDNHQVRQEFSNERNSRYLQSEKY